jgi:3-hydroxyisobutyrate dehydrogenase
MNAVPERVGLIGLGNMGRPMGRRIAAGGYALTVHDLDPARIAAFRAEVPAARAADSAAAAGAASDILVTMLPDGQAVREALLGAAGALPALTAGATVIDMSSSSPLGTRQLGAELARHGVHLVDAPVSGGVRRAVDGTLSIMAGCDSPALERVLALLGTMGTVMRAGPLGAGHAIKALNNYVSAAGLVAACEAVQAARRFGLDPATAVEIIDASTGMNNSTRNKLRQFVLSESYADGFALALMAKDLRTALEVARACGAPTALAAPLVELWNAAERELEPGANHTEIARWLDRQSGA